MKSYTFSAVGLLAAAGLAQAQIDERFNAVSGGLGAPGWFVQNNSSPVGGTTYFQGTTSVFPAYVSPGYLGVNFHSGAGLATISNWQVTPAMPLQNGQQLLFLTRTVTAAAYPDRLQVRLAATDSTNVGTGPTDVGDFTQLLLDINPNYTLLDYPTAWTQYVVTLSGLPGPVTGRLAFRYFVEGGGPLGIRSDYIGVDEAVFPAVLGACCLSSGACVFTAASVCSALAGVYQGNGVACLANCQPQPAGACCLTDGTCTIVTGTTCVGIGGTFFGPSTTCAQAACGTTCHSAQGLNVVIPDGGIPTNGTAGADAIATLNITEHGLIQTMTAKLHITHSWQGDVRARLVHPDGITSLDLVNRPGVSPPKQGASTTLGFAFSNFGTPTSNMRFANGAVSAVYDSAAGTPGANATAVDNVAGVWTPVGGSFAPFVGKDIFGTWQLIVNDYMGGDSGAIRSFSVCATTVPVPCYPNCDGSTTEPCLNVQDFGCFLNAFGSSETYANCDLSTVAPILNVQDFGCFLNSFATGCSNC